MRIERSRAVPWAERGEGRPLMQPERWDVSFSRTQQGCPGRILGRKQGGQCSNDGKRLRGDPHEPAQGYDHAGALDPADWTHWQEP